MSLVTLTFGYGKQDFSVPSMMHVSYPKDHIKLDPNTENKLEVLKVTTFYNCPDVYLVGRVISGVVKETMHSRFQGKEITVSKLDSQLKGIGKQGSVVGFNIEGFSPEDISKGTILDFCL